MVESIYNMVLEDNEDIMKSLGAFFAENGITYGFFVSGSGTMKDVELVYTEPNHGISKNLFREEMRIKAVSGQIERGKDGEINYQLNVSVIGDASGSKAGQLVSGKAARTMKIGVRKVDIKKMMK
ncbi:MAG: DUF296 domain-containing protein [archaeon]